MENVIELKDLSVTLGRRRVLSNLSVQLHGQVIGLLGPNGAGKSTLIQTLLGFCPNVTGTASVLGRDIRTDIRGVRGLIGYMPENDAFVAGMTAVTFVRMMGELSGLPAEAALERAHEVLFYVGLGEARYRKLGTYSLGMKQLAKLAQAIVHGPKMLILDEPTNGLDPPARQRMLRLIDDVKASGATRLIICSHLLRDVEAVCDEVLILKQGRIAHHCDLNSERAANKHFLEVEAAGELDGFAAALAAAGCEVSPGGPGRFRMELPEGFDLKTVFSMAAQREVRLHRVSYRRDTLEDIFLSAMEN